MARLGADLTLERLLVLAQDASATKRIAAVRTIGLLLDQSVNPDPVAPVALQKIDAALERAVRDDNLYVRDAARNAVDTRAQRKMPFSFRPSAPKNP